jgi:hypothetical protein
MGDDNRSSPVRNIPFEAPAMADVSLDTMTAFFIGRIVGHGVFEDRFGRPRRTFGLSIVGRLDRAHLILEEDFTYDDGARERRTWRFERRGPSSFVATAADCIGEAIGEISPNRWRLRYGFMLRLKDRLVPVDFDDRLYVVSPRLAINRATMRKWGVRLGTVTIVYERVAALESDAEDLSFATAA